MKSNRAWRVTLAQVVLCASILIALLVVRGSRAQSPVNSTLHLPEDWTHHFMVFSLPKDVATALQLRNNPRYVLQFMRQHGLQAGPAVSSGTPEHRDWGMSLGANAIGTPGQWPAKFGFDPNQTPSCAGDYVAFNSRLTSLSVVAFDNLYATQGSVGGFCNVNGPSVKWAYDTRISGDTTGTTPTSIALSLDGTKIMYVETRTSVNGGAILHILKWKPGTGTTIQGTIASPAVPDQVLAAGANWSTCTAANSCVVNIVLSGGQPDSNSSPWIDYSSDVGYVGDDNGRLHKITGVFNGAPVEVTTSPWPIVVNSGAKLASPVWDSWVSGNIFVGDSTGRLSFVREVGSTVPASGGCTAPCLSATNAALGGSIIDGTMMDVSIGKLIVADGTDANNGSVYQFDTGLTAASKVTVNVGGTLASTLNTLYDGSFDDAYYSVGPGSGHFYQCGKDPAFANRPAIYKLSFTSAGVLNSSAGTPLVGLVSANITNKNACSEVTDFKNGTTDRIFFGVVASANPPANGGTSTGCVSGLGCIMSIDLPATWPPTATTAGAFASGGTTSIVIDNSGTGAQESNIYYEWLANSVATHTCNGTSGVGCAVKSTQAGLN